MSQQSTVQPNLELEREHGNLGDVDLEANLPEAHTGQTDSEQIMGEIRRSRSQTEARQESTNECVQLNRCQV